MPTTSGWINNNKTVINPKPNRESTKIVSPSPTEHQGKDDYRDNCLNTMNTVINSDEYNCSELLNDFPLQMDEFFPQSWKEKTPGLIPEESPLTNDSLSKEAISRQERIIKEIWPTVTQEAKSEFPEFTKMYEDIRAQAAPNFLGAQIPVKSGLVITEWEHRLQEYHDQLLCKFLKFGWPLGYHRLSPPKTVTSNHPSALQYMPHVRQFIEAELEYEAVLGPFKNCPFSQWCRLSPIMTRPKRE